MSKANLAGYYKIVVHKGDESKPSKIVDWFPNLITNQGLDFIGTSGGCMSYLIVGSSSVEPSVTDVGVLAPVGSIVSYDYSKSTNGSSSVAPYYVWRRHCFVFNPNEATGNLSELAVLRSNNNTSAFSRSLIKENGQPITVTVLEDDYLTIYYELRIYPDTVDKTATVSLGGVSYDVITRPAGVNTSGWSASDITNYGLAQMLNSVTAYDGTIGSVFQTPNYAESATNVQSDVVFSTYVIGSYERTCTFKIAVNKANFTNNLRSLTLKPSIGFFQCQFTPAIPKTVNNVLTLTFKFSWGRL